MTDHSADVPAAQADAPTTLAHRLTPMRGRDPGEAHRVATPLELLFDLTFVVAFSVAGQQASHLFAEGHLTSALLGFGFAMFAIMWAWINYSWFASAFDCDDWVYRLTTMVQMVGVVVLAIGLPTAFASIDSGTLDNQVVVVGYIVMRVAMVAQWLRAARQAPEHRRAAMTYVVTILVAQFGWVVQAFAPLGVPATVTLAGALVLIEMSGPVIAERRQGGTPWHAHHIAERYSLVAIITLGEGVVGTVATLGAVVADHGWTAEAGIVAVCGIGVIVGMWWIYFMLPSGEVLHRHRERSFVWGYGHMVVFAALAFVGAGLHVVALQVEAEAGVAPVVALAAMAVPVTTFVLGVFALYTYLTRTVPALHIGLVIGSVLVAVLALVLVAAGVPVIWAMPVVALVPYVTVIGYETVGHRGVAGAIEASGR